MILSPDNAAQIPSARGIEKFLDRPPTLKASLAEIPRGPHRHEIAAAFHAACLPNYKRYIAWDLPEVDRPQAFANALANAAFACLGFINGKPHALAFLNTMSGHAALVHFAAIGPTPLLPELAKLFLHHARARGFKSLLAFLPKPFRHIRHFAQSLGFQQACLLHQAFNLPGKARAYDAVVIYLNFGEEENRGETHRHALLSIPVSRQACNGDALRAPFGGQKTLVCGRHPAAFGGDK